MKRVFFTIGILLAITRLAFGSFGGLVYHEVQITDEIGRPMTIITSVTVRTSGTTDAATIYSDRARSLVITQPMTSSSTNTTLDTSNGTFFWFGDGPWDFTVTDGTNIHTNNTFLTMSASDALIIFPSYLTSINTSSFTDAQSQTFGSDSDWVFNGGGEANVYKGTPASDGAEFRIGVSGTTKNADFNVYVGTLLGLKINEGTPSFIWDGGVATINASSNFNTGINTGTSTGTVTIGNSASGAFTLDTTDTITMNSDGAFAITTSDGSADITLDAVAGSVNIVSGENAALAITFTANNGSSETIVTTNTQGTSLSAITQVATAGGINMDSELETNIQVAAAGSNLVLGSTLGSVYIEGEEDVALAILITADGGTSSTMRFFNDTGTGAASIEFLTDLGGITGTASAGPILFSAIGGTVGDVTISAGDILTMTSVDVKIFDGATTETWEIEGTANGFETTIVFTDPTADATMRFPDIGDEGAAGGDIAWLADGGSITKDGTNAAIPLTDAVVLGTSTGASAWSLANGEEGQILTVVIVTDGGEAIITPATSSGWATAVMTDPIDAITMQYVDDSVGWIVLGTSDDGTNQVAITQ